MKKYVIGLDIGTSSVKGVLVSSDDLEICSKTRKFFVYDTDPCGKVEIPADRFIESCLSALRDLSVALTVDSEISGICASSASGNLLLLDDEHKPITPIINWQDKRTADETEKVLGSDFDYDEYYKLTGWRFDGSTFPLASLCRLKTQSPALLDRAAHITMSTEYLHYILTGREALSTSTGTPFYLIDQQKGEYIDFVLQKLDIAKEKLPEIVPLGTEVGKITGEAAKKCGIREGTSVYAGSFDHPGAARGVNVYDPGELLLSCGTSWVCFFPVESRDIAVNNNMLIDPFTSQSGGYWAGMTSMASIASVIESYIRTYICSSGNIYETFEALSYKSQPGAGGLRINLDNSDDSNYISLFPKEHIARAIMESVAGKLKESLDSLARGGIHAKKAVMTGGPSECKLWADVLEYVTGLKVTICQGAYAGALGAAKICINNLNGVSENV